MFSDKPCLENRAFEPKNGPDPDFGSFRTCQPKPYCPSFLICRALDFGLN